MTMLDPFLILPGLFVLSAILVTAYGLYKLYRGKRRTPADTAVTWERDQEMLNLIEHTQELSTLYGKLGYSPALVRRSEAVATELKALIRAEIPDFVVFQRALHTGLKQLEREPERYRRGDDDLLHAILAAGSDQEKVLALLNRNPVEEALPFIEELPFAKEGQIIWRTPSEVSIIRKRPVDPARFAALLDEAESLVMTSRVSHNPQAQQVLDAIARVRRDLQRENAYMPTSLQTLAKRLHEWIDRRPHAAAQARRQSLDALLAGLVEVRHQCGAHAQRSRRMHSADLAARREMAQPQAKRYLESHWMHTPWLTTYILTTMLDLELAALSQERERASGTAPLRLIRNEVASGHYDSAETIRRLRQQETQGVYVPSLVYPLLRLHSPPDPPSREA